MFWESQIILEHSKNNIIYKKNLVGFNISADPRPLSLSLTLTYIKFQKVNFQIDTSQKIESIPYPHFPVDLREVRLGLMLLLQPNPLLPQGWTILKAEVSMVTIDINIIIVMLYIRRVMVQR